jgi:hypothetical protein
MQAFVSRKLKFKAWNTTERLLMRLNSIDCVRGELTKKDHILLQFTGMFDKQEEEIYEMDVLLKGNEKFLVRWNEAWNGWYFTPIENENERQALIKSEAAQMIRLCNYFEGSVA